MMAWYSWVVLYFAVATPTAVLLGKSIKWAREHPDRG